MTADWLEVAAKAAQENEHAQAELIRCRAERNTFAAAVGCSDAWAQYYAAEVTANRQPLPLLAWAKAQQEEVQP